MYAHGPPLPHHLSETWKHQSADNMEWSLCLFRGICDFSLCLYLSLRWECDSLDEGCRCSVKLGVVFPSCIWLVVATTTSQLQPAEYPEYYNTTKVLTTQPGTNNTTKYLQQYQILTTIPVEAKWWTLPQKLCLKTSSPIMHHQQASAGCSLCRELEHLRLEGLSANVSAERERGRREDSAHGTTKEATGTVTRLLFWWFNIGCAAVVMNVGMSWLTNCRIRTSSTQHTGCMHMGLAFCLCT